MQNNKIRITKEKKKDLRYGRSPRLEEKLAFGKVGYEKTFMVAGGVSYYGVSKLVFCAGNMNTESYIKTLDFFCEDVKRLNSIGETTLYFQQDGAPCHNSVESKTHITNLFPLEMTWPANSPDLSPIELIWLRVEYELRKKTYKNLYEIRSALI